MILPLFTGGGTFGETATHRTLAAVAVDNAAYKHPMTTLVSFSSLAGVKGSNTGNDKALQATFKSVTKF